MKPKKADNISRVMADVRHPFSRKEDTPKSKRSKRPWRLGVVLVAIFLIVGYVALLGGSVANVYNGFKDLANSLTLDGRFSLADSIVNLEKELGELDRRARFIALTPSLQEIPVVISELREVVGIIGGLASDVDIIQSDAITFALAGNGGELMDTLRRAESRLARLDELNASLQDRTSEFDFGDEDLDFVTDTLKEVRDTIGTLIAFLGESGSKRMVLLFENPSELRPSGGFAGSYGEMVIENGGMKELLVNDIYYPDKFLPLEVVPPIQLQGITPDFGARDTGWFFDFATSAENLIDYLEASDIYEDGDTRFDGVVAVNVRVVEDLLRLVGPIEVPEYGLVLNHNNFLDTIRAQVEADKKPGENPKAVLQFVTPRLIDGLKSISDGNKEKLLSVLINRTNGKDIKFYFEDRAMDALVTRFGVDGRSYEVEDGFQGDYLALVNTNVAGAKTDVVVSQRAILRSEISPSGRISNKLVVTRSHMGDRREEPWYNHINRNFFKAFTPLGSDLSYIEGGEEHEVTPSINYSTSGYGVDPDLAKVEETRTILGVRPDGYAESYVESAKQVFATWFNLEPGESRSLEMRYDSGEISLVNNRRFTFVLDKQSGSEMDFEYLLAAPDGFYWEESGDELFRYREDKLPTRVELELTLKQR